MPGRNGSRCSSPSAVTAVLAGAGGAYCWFAAGLRPFTLPIDAAVAIPVLIAVGRSLRAERGASPVPAPSPRQIAPWAALIALLAALETDAYLSSPRSEYPTLSVIADGVMSTHAGRAGVFALWLLLGWLWSSKRAAA